MTSSLVSPWLTTQEVAEFARVHEETVRRAAVEYQRSKGKSGLKTYQRKPNTEHRFTREDVDRWIAGEPPAAPAKAARSKRVAA
jgi:hypothetical protein